MYSSNLPALCRKRDLWRDLAFIWWAGGKFISFHPSLTFFCCYRWFYLDEFLNIFKKSVNNLKLFKKADSFMEKKSRERRGLDLWILWRWTEFPSALFFFGIYMEFCYYSFIIAEWIREKEPENFFVGREIRGGLWTKLIFFFFLFFFALLMKLFSTNFIYKEKGCRLCINIKITRMILFRNRRQSQSCLHFHKHLSLLKFYCCVKKESLKTAFLSPRG